jgi:hypothetical protein
MPQLKGWLTSQGFDPQLRITLPPFLLSQVHCAFTQFNREIFLNINPSNAELNPICHLLAL